MSAACLEIVLSRTPACHLVRFMSAHVMTCDDPPCGNTVLLCTPLQLAKYRNVLITCQQEFALLPERDNAVGMRGCPQHDA